MKDSLKTFKFKPRIQEKHDLSKLLYAKKASLVNRLSQDLKTKRGLKWFMSVQVKLFKPKADGSDEISEPHFRSLCKTTVNVHEIEEQLNEVNQTFLSAFTSYQKGGRGWIRVRDCAFLIANATKNIVLATRISQLVASGRPTIKFSAVCQQVSDLLSCQCF